MTASLNDHILISTYCDLVPYTTKIDFADGIKGGELEMRCFSQGVPCIFMEVLIRKRQEHHIWKRAKYVCNRGWGIDWAEGKQREEKVYRFPVGFEVGVRGHHTGTIDDFQKIARQSPPIRKLAPVIPFFQCSKTPLRTSELQDCRIMNLCCFSAPCSGW